MAKRRKKGAPRVVPMDLDYLIGITAKLASKTRAPQLSLSYRDPDWMRFLKRCTPQNIYGLARAHAHSLQNMAALARHLEDLGCRCDAEARGADHVEICPLQLRRHPVFQAFDATAIDEPEPPDESASDPTPEAEIQA